MQEGGDHAEDGEECGPMEGKHWAWRDRERLDGSPVTEAARKMRSPKHASLVTAGPSPKTCSEAPVFLQETAGDPVILLLH